MMFSIRDTETGFGGISERDAIKALRRVSRSPGDSLDAFMRELAERSQQQCGRPIRWSTPELLIADLLEAGLIVRIM